MKKVISILMTSILFLGLGLTGGMEVKAADGVVCIDGSYLLDDVKESAGEMTNSTWGYYLQSGYSSLSEIATGKIGAGGDTSAHRIVDEISVYVKVQRLVNGSWQNYLTWSAADTDSAFVSTSKTLYVPTGYYYRVSCTHYAGTDSGGSYTNALYI